MANSHTLSLEPVLQGALLQIALVLTQTIQSYSLKLAERIGTR
jgi:hypothetical protein